MTRRTFPLLLFGALLVGQADGQTTARSFDWTLGTWEGTRRDAADGTTDTMRMVIDPILDGSGQIRHIEIPHDRGTYRGFAVQVHHADSETWTRRYTNEGRGTFSVLTGTGLDNHSIWSGKSSKSARLSRLHSEFQAPDRWTRTMTISTDSGKTWEKLWIDELQRTVDHNQSQDLVVRFTESFNNHDPDGMVALADQDIEWLSIMEDTVVVEVSGREALHQAMTGYFDALPSVRSELETFLESPPYLITRERAFWQSTSGERSQASLAIYEIRNNLIRRVWYFPADE